MNHNCAVSQPTSKLGFRYINPWPTKYKPPRGPSQTSSSYSIASGIHDFETKTRRYETINTSDTMDSISSVSLYSYASFAWLTVQALPLAFWPTFVLAMLTPDFKQAERMSSDPI